MYLDQPPNKPCMLWGSALHVIPRTRLLGQRVVCLSTYTPTIPTIALVKCSPLRARKRSNDSDVATWMSYSVSSSSSLSNLICNTKKGIRINREPLKTTATFQRQTPLMGTDKSGCTYSPRASPSIPMYIVLSN